MSKRIFNKISLNFPTWIPQIRTIIIQSKGNNTYNSSPFFIRIHTTRIFSFTFNHTIYFFLFILIAKKRKKESYKCVCMFHQSLDSREYISSSTWWNELRSTDMERNKMISYLFFLTQKHTLTSIFWYCNLISYGLTCFLINYKQTVCCWWSSVVPFGVNFYFEERDTEEAKILSMNHSRDFFYYFFFFCVQKFLFFHTHSQYSPRLGLIIRRRGGWGGKILRKKKNLW